MTLEYDTEIEELRAFVDDNLLCGNILPHEAELVRRVIGILATFNVALMTTQAANRYLEAVHNQERRARQRWTLLAIVLAYILLQMLGGGLTSETLGNFTGLVGA